MKQKLLVVMLSCVLCAVGWPLTVSAESSKGNDWDMMPFDDRMSLDDIREGIADLGFEDGIFWVTMLYEGQDPNDVAIVVDDLQVEEFRLEPGKFYTVETSIIAIWDKSERRRNSQTFIQARFPQAVLADDINAFGIAIMGEHVKCVGQTVPVTVAQDLRIHYVQDSAQMMSLATDGFTKVSAQDLLESESGLCLKQLLSNGNREDIPIVVSFLTYSIYTEPIESTTVVEEPLNFWARQEINGEAYTFAPATTVTMVDKEGNFIERSAIPPKVLIPTIVLAVMTVGCVIIATILIIIDRRRAKSDPIGYWQGKE